MRSWGTCFYVFYEVVRYMPRKHWTLNHCLANVSPPSTTLVQHWPNIGSMTRVYWVEYSCVVLSEAVDWCICFTRKNQHGRDWERSRPQGPKNVHNLLIAVRSVSWAYGHGTELLLNLKKTIFDLIIRGQVLDMTVQRNVPRFCTGSIWG